MTTYLLAGGGTAGHVNPLLATADEIRRLHPSAEVLVLGCATGLEARLVPERGYELLVIPRVPFPRRPDLEALEFLPRFSSAVRQVKQTLRSRHVDVVCGFGGYASTPAYVAARRLHIPYVVHEANARPGLANRLGARSTDHVAVTFAGTPLRHAVTVGMPLRSEIERMDRSAARLEAAAFFNLDAQLPTLLITGGSLGAKRLNVAFAARARQIVDAGFQVIHVGGSRNDVEDPGVAGYVFMSYCDRMDLALALATCAVSRSGASTVAELSALAIPAVYVPYPHGNGEQALNAHAAVAAGAAILVEDAVVSPAWIDEDLLPLLQDSDRVAAMRAAAERSGINNASTRLVRMIDESAHSNEH